jgi:hypothetical protein
MPRTSLTVALLLPLAAHAADFDARVAQAEATIATPDGYAYDLALVPAIHAATARCVPPGRAAARKADSFVAVASVDSAGRVHDVAVRPLTKLSQCFARQLATTKLQPPPRRSAVAGRHPILVRIRDAF